MDPIRIAVAGAAGRMGRTIIRCVVEDCDCRLAGAIENTGSAFVGSDAGVLSGASETGVAITAECASSFDAADALVDFTVPVASVELAQQAADHRVAHVIGTTGFSQEQEARIEAASEKTVIIKSGNMSLGANVLVALVAKAAKSLCDFDVQIVEMHHRMKKDAPSGTALMLGRAVADGRGLARYLDDCTQGNGDIGFASLRGGTVVGEHSVIFAGTNERLILEHVAEDRAIFARGAIAAAKWARGQKPGLYTML